MVSNTRVFNGTRPPMATVIEQFDVTREHVPTEPARALRCC